MLRKTLVLFAALSTLAGTGCASHPTQKPVDAEGRKAVAALRADNSPREQPSDCKLHVSLPPGWKRTSPATLVNAALDARIELVAGKSTKTVMLEMRQFCRMLNVEGWKCGTGKIAADGSEGYFPYRLTFRRGIVAIRHQIDGNAVILRGEWLTENDKKVQEDFLAIFDSIEAEAVKEAK